jgi:pyruvate kinase
MVNMFDFSSLSVSSVASTPAVSVSEVQAHLKDAAIQAVFPYGVDGMVQTDTAKFAIPFDYEGAIHWVEVSFVAKKDDFDAVKAEHDYQVKLQHGLEREQARQAKREAKAKTA